MVRLTRWSCVLFAIVLTASASSAPTSAAVTREEVEKAIRDGVRFLHQRQSPDGNWPGVTGTTELATLALLSSGDKPTDPEVARALSTIRQNHTPDRIEPHHKTYTLGLQTMVFAAADPDGYRDLIARNAEWLIRNRMMSTHRVVGGSASLHHRGPTWRRSEASATTRTPSMPCSA